MLELFLGEPQQRTEPDFLPVGVLQRRLRHHGNNKFLHESEDMAVGVAHDLVQLALLVVVQTCDVVNTTQSIRQETLREIEILPCKNIVLFPRYLLGIVETFLVGVIVRKHRAPPQRKGILGFFE